ncbi:M1 family metallopeptidase [Bacteroidia bacterium]|nr:M1 family metallopeptidase [Bacteroidia bacterium]MDB9883336.1 M1 family metallopeptidase [Bacteroidia bacterium]
MQRNILVLLTLLINYSAICQSKSQSQWQQQVDYTVAVSLDDINHVLTGDIEMVYTNNSPNELGVIYLHLWPNGYQNLNTAFAKQMQENGEMDFYYSKPEEKGSIDGLAFKVDGDNVNVEIVDDNIDVIKLLLTSPVKSGQKVTISTPFKVKVPKVFSRLGHENQDYFITQWYPKPAVYDVNGWNPMPYLNMGEFYSEFGSFDVSVSLPKNYTIVATGECKTKGELKAQKSGTTPEDDLISSTERKTVRFTASDVLDFAWFASKRWGYVTKEITVGDKTVLTRVVGANPKEKNLEHIKTAITYYSDNVGPYPYSHATVVHGELKAGGGMEYPMITLCDYMSEEVIVHEVGHNWFYGILANNERIYPWMDESINSYYEGQAMSGDSNESNFNSDFMNAMVNDNLLRNEHQAIATSSEELTNGNYGMSVYGVGASAFGYLKGYLGDSMFLKCMTTYYDEWKFKHPLPDNMKKSWEATSGKSLSWFFDEMLQSDTKLDYSVCKSKDGFVLKNKSNVSAPVPIEITENGLSNTEWYQLKSKENMTIPSSASDRLAVIDPNKISLDMNIGNNASSDPIKFKFGTGVDKPGVKEVYVVPTFGWNVYDRTMLGLGIHNYAIANKPLQYHLFPMYSFEQKSLNGTAGLMYTKPLKRSAEYLEMGIDAKSFNYEERGRRNPYKYLKVAPSVSYHLPKKEQRSLIERSFKLQYDFIALSPQFELERDTLSGPISTFEHSRNFTTLEYKYANNKKINGYSWQVLAEYGQVTKNGILGDLNNPQDRYYIYDSTGAVQDTISFFPFLGKEKSSKDMFRLSSIFKYKMDIGIKDKPLEIRLFGAYTFKNLDGEAQYQNTIGSSDKAGYYDYRFDDYLMHRNAEYGLFQNQIPNRRDFSKFVGLLVDNESWLVSTNISVPLPGKIPIKPYAEFLMYEDLGKESWNKSGAKMIYNVGLELEVIPNRLEIFFNLAQSKDVTEYQEGVNYPSNIGGFADRITFVLDLNGLMPTKLKKQLKLF